MAVMEIVLLYFFFFLNSLNKQMCLTTNKTMDHCECVILNFIVSFSMKSHFKLFSGFVLMAEKSMLIILVKKSFKIARKPLSFLGGVQEYARDRLLSY